MVCKSIDNHGKWHFPNHAQHSYDMWKELNLFEAQLMLHDMDIHCLKSEDIPNFCALPFAPLLLLSGLAEIYANCEQFGGQESLSFKIKYKHLAKRGRQVLEYLDKQKSCSY